MRYLFMCYSDEHDVEAMGEAKLEALVDDQIACNEDLRLRGHLLASEALQSATSATTVRVRNGRSSVTDGPFAETKEQVGGVFIVEARDLNEAIRLASSFPIARVGSLEIRPVWELHDRRGQPTVESEDDATSGDGSPIRTT